ncbi:MBL fold metallo-hydrolase [Lutibaculum baratangense]|uniref:Putative metal-binding enzyme n=1 Tax=Lutibaculum baratangense AMV1 TaxID=631454 RepID=V4T9J6_9HYPH|nr:MBL fold metallo-hydrolase [Lutibaculum baratangense]ESR23193.1 putative metal-binding enzyme [Lutibaculum baratangense AMV1]
MAKLNAAIVVVTPIQQNCTILFDEETRKGVVIDPGGDLARIDATLQELRVEPEKIVLTHGHIDHAGGAAEMRQAKGLKIYGPHQADRPLLERLEMQGIQYGISGVRNVTPDQWLSEGETIEMAGETFDILHCPGHSPGSVVFVHKKARFAIVGDVLFNGSVGRTDLPGGDPEALLHSIRNKLFPLGDDIQFLCGHGPGGMFGEERVNNPFVGDNARLA